MISTRMTITTISIEMIAATSKTGMPNSDGGTTSGPSPTLVFRTVYAVSRTSLKISFDAETVMLHPPAFACKRAASARVRSVGTVPSNGNKAMPIDTETEPRIRPRCESGVVPILVLSAFREVETRSLAHFRQKHRELLAAEAVGAPSSPAASSMICATYCITTSPAS